MQFIIWNGNILLKVINSYPLFIFTNLDVKFYYKMYKFELQLLLNPLRYYSV